MLVEARATGYVYHSGNDLLEVRVSGPSSGEAAGKPGTATLLLDAKRRLVGVDLRDTAAGCVLMLGAHEDVEHQVKASVRVELDGDGGLVALGIPRASASIDAPINSAY